MLVYLRDRPAQTIAHTRTQRGVADQTFYLTQSQCTDTGPVSPSAVLIMPGTGQGSAWSTNFFKSLV